MRKIQRILLEELKVPEESRIDLMKQLFSVLPKPVSHNFQISLLNSAGSLPPSMLVLHEMLKSEQEYVTTLELITKVSRTVFSQQGRRTNSEDAGFRPSHSNFPSEGVLRRANDCIGCD